MPVNTLDHFLVTAELSTFITDAGFIHGGDTIFGHSPIYLERERERERESSFIGIKSGDLFKIHR